MIKKVLTFIFIIGLICVIGIGIFLGNQWFSDKKVNHDAEEYLIEFDELISKKTDNIELIQEEVMNDKLEELRDIEEIKTSYKGFIVSGKIEIPKTGIKYPILSEMTDSRALEQSICIQYYQEGASLNGSGNTVIIGHNYRSGLFFGDNDKLENGDSVFITDTQTGKKIEYKIYKKFITSEEDTSFYNRNTEGAKEITLVTCKKNDNSNRLVLLAREI